MQETKPRCIICDIDNTILDITHRFHLLNGVNTDWDAFLAEDAIMQDKPIWDTINIVGCLGKFFPVVFITGRNEGIRAITETQLSQIFGMNPILCGKELYMRTDGDWRKDTEIKKELYEKHVKDKYHVVAAFDDKTSIIELWRSLGITAYHVGELATGDGF